MNITVNTFGEQLKIIMKDKKISQENFADSLGIQRSSLRRILTDDCKQATRTKFLDGLIKTNPIHLSEKSIKSLESALIVNIIGKSQMEARLKLLEIFESTDQVKSKSNYTIYMNNNKEQTFEKCFKTSYTDPNIIKLEVYIINTLDNQLLLDLASSLENLPVPNDKIIIHHLLNYNGHPTCGAEIVTDIYPFISYNNYYLYINDTTKDDSFSKSAHQQNRIIISYNNKITRKTDVYEIIDHDSICKLSFPGEGSAYYNFVNTIFSKLTDDNMFVRLTASASNQYEQIEKVSQWYLDKEMKYDQIFIVPNFCYQMLTYEILISLAQDSAFLVAKEDLPKFASLSQIYKERIETFETDGNINKTMIFSQAGLEYFARTGLLSDHVKNFRPLNKDERNTVINKMLYLMKNKKTVNIYILKDSFEIGSTEMVLFQKNGSYIYNAEAGYLPQPEFYVDLKPLVNLLEDFAVNHLIPNYTLSNDEAIGFFKGLLV